MKKLILPISLGFAVFTERIAADPPNGEKHQNFDKYMEIATSNPLYARMKLPQIPQKTVESCEFLFASSWGFELLSFTVDETVIESISLSYGDHENIFSGSIIAHKFLRVNTEIDEIVDKLASFDWEIQKLHTDRQNIIDGNSILVTIVKQNKTRNYYLNSSQFHRIFQANDSELSVLFEKVDKLMKREGNDRDGHPLNVPK